MWECGLKLSGRPLMKVDNKSLLMWECGLKPKVNNIAITCAGVTPYVGVWIETL